MKPPSPSDSSDHSSALTTLTDHDEDEAAPVAPQLQQRRQQLRDFERKSRRNRVTKAATMRTQVENLEQFALTVRVVADPDAVWDEFLDDDTKRLRDKLRGLELASREAQSLTQEKTLLQRRLTEHELARRAITRRLDHMLTAADDWQVHTRRWRSLAKCHFHPLTTQQSLALVQAAQQEIQQFEMNPDRATTGMSIMGWRDSSLLSHNASRLEFRFDKSYTGHDMDHHIEMMRRIYSEADLYMNLSLGRRVRASITVLQQLSSTAWVVYFTKSYAEMPATTHHLYLLACVATEDGGAIQYITPIHDTDLQRVISSPTDMWTDSSYWIRWELLDKSATKSRRATDYKVCIGGSLQVDDPAYLDRWLFALLGVVIRSEAMTSERSLLDFS